MRDSCVSVYMKDSCAIPVGEYIWKPGKMFLDISVLVFSYVSLGGVGRIHSEWGLAALSKMGPRESKMRDDLVSICSSGQDFPPLPLNIRTLALLACMNCRCVGNAWLE